MARLAYFLVAENVSIDLHTNSLSVFGVLEHLELQRLDPRDAALMAATAPDGMLVIVPQMTCVMTFVSEEGDEGTDFQAVCRLHVPGNLPKDLAANFQFKPGSPRHRIVQRVGGVPFAKPGEFCVELLLNGREVARYAVQVTLPALPSV